MLAAAAAKQSDIPYCIVFSYWQRRVSTTLQKLNARVLYLAQCKIAGDQQPGAGFADLFRVINGSKISIEIKLLSCISYYIHLSFICISMFSQ
jgi:hypothetical protein